MEEVILIDGQKLSEVIIPLMNVDRRTRHGIDVNEPHKAQIYVTTAGYKNTFAYQKMIQLLVWQVTKGNAFVFGGDYRIPMMHGLLAENFVDELKEDSTYNEMSFAREYESLWSGSSEDAFFSAEMIDRNRVLTVPEYAPSKKIKGVRYVIAADVARSSKKHGKETVAWVIKMIPRNNGTYVKHIVNCFVLKGEHFDDQAIKLKKLVALFDASQLVVDGQGLGVGLTDRLIKENVDENTGEVYPPFSVTNDDAGEYTRFKKSNSRHLLYILKATSGNASDIHTNCLSQISSGKVKFLTDEMTAKHRLLAAEAEDTETKRSSEEVSDYLTPFISTSMLKDEMMNLKKRDEGVGRIALDEVNKRVGHDRFSALEYGLWYIKTLEDKNLSKKVSDPNDISALFSVRKPKWS